MRSTLPDFQLPMSVRCATAYGYGRQSKRDSIDAGEGIPQQGCRTRAYWEGILKPQGVENFVFIPDESAVSARTNPFMARHAGKQLIELLQPGDHFIIDKVDRLWRSMEDFVEVMRMFKQRGVVLHICNLMGASITLGTPMGDAFMNIAITFAQLESDQCSDRTRARFAGRRAEGRYPGSPTPIGCKLIGDVEKENGRVLRDTRRFAWCTERRRFMGEIVRLADEKGMNCSDVRGKLRTHFREFMGEHFFKTVIVENDWPAYTVAKYYWRERQYRALRPFDPNTVLFRIFDPPKSSGKAFRDFGRSEPKTPNVYPFMDGRRIPTVQELCSSAS